MLHLKPFNLNHTFRTRAQMFEPVPKLKSPAFAPLIASPDAPVPLIVMLVPSPETTYAVGPYVVVVLRSLLLNKIVELFAIVLNVICALVSEAMTA